MKNQTTRSRLDLSDLRAKLGESQGKEYWRSLDELAETEEFQQLLENEFSASASQWTDPVGRRRFLRLMGASFALAGLAGCTRQPEEKILPYAKFPEASVPGKPRYFASALALGGYADGVLVESHMGRPTKIEGNPDHPASLGKSDVLGQAAILGLYDPDRSQVVVEAGRISSWRNFVGALNRQMGAQRLKAGAGLRILTQATTSPTLFSQITSLLDEFPEARWHQYEPLSRHTFYEGTQRAFGEDVHLVHEFDKADVVLSLGSDFLTQGPGHIRHARDFVARRRPEPGQPAEQTRMNRLYAVETVPTSTGAFADHRLRLKASGFEAFARALAAELGVRVAPPAPRDVPEHAQAWIGPLARDLAAHRGRAIVIAGDEQPASVHALVHAINDRLGSFGRTIRTTVPVEARPVNQLASLSELVRDMPEGRVETLVILGGNPVYDAPADLDFARALDRVPFRAHLGLYDDETARLCHWHIPEAHQLESWGDARAYDGTVSIQQPLIAPLYGGKTASEVVATMHGAPETSVYDLLRQYWSKRLPDADFEKAWRRVLHDGAVPDSTVLSKSVSLRPDFDRSDGPPEANGRLEINFRGDACVHDGRFANLGWLQELPKPLTKLTWDNAALMSPATAEQLGLANEDVVELRFDARAVKAPVWVMPGHVDDSVTVHLGYGRTRVGRIGNSVGFNAYMLRTSKAFWSSPGLEVAAAGERYPLAGTQDHHSMEGRHLVRSAPLEQFREQPDFAQQFDHAAPPGEAMLFPGYEYKEGYAWGMAIDLNSCIGCNACVIGCQSENNIPVVGKEEVLNAREMHWIRLDRYYSGSLDEPDAHFQPLTCMQCENAPCELVCPVGATVHSSEGLNDMVYNRCVGTRYCSNNCPYKVRRFNFLSYSDFETQSLKLMRNPDVTVRTRGVMEKCTYCVQRINSARITAEKEGRKIEDGEVTTACQAVCPADAIVFGDINDPESRVSKAKASPRNYSLLTELNTEPRTSYLARLRNPNPELAAQAGEQETDQNHG